MKNSKPAFPKKFRPRRPRKQEKRTKNNIYEQRIFTNITNYESFIRNIPARRRQAIGFVVRIQLQHQYSMTDTSSVIIEIRPGAGGGEAALFGADLFKMYRNYSAKKGFSFTALDLNPTSIGGFKQAVFEITGQNVSDIFRNEAGVHRVQRVPKTEKSGRVHTSTVSVAVLKKATEKDVKINPADLRIEFFRSSGPGGQNVNKRETAVRIIHLPTGAVVTAQTERGQESNKQFALSILRSKILENVRSKEDQKMQSERKTQIGSADRSEKIRTYNFSQDRITDHRVKKNWHNLENILDGNMEPIVKAFIKADAN